MKTAKEWLQISWTHKDTAKFIRDIQYDALESASLAAVEEPELPGDMPDEMWESIKGDRDAVAEALRIAVRKPNRESCSASANSNSANDRTEPHAPGSAGGSHNGGPQ